MKAVVLSFTQAGTALAAASLPACGEADGMSARRR